MKKPNALLGQNSPYLKQHLYNPVEWYPWGEDALQKARSEDKPLLVSVGYSACHWCHVMERESFEDAEVARLMNAHFVCVKVDREERPDVDHLYMNAVQMLTGRGGWPLNCFALPDGRPFWGGTYFPKDQWKSILSRIAELYEKQRQDIEEQAGKITGGIAESGFIEIDDGRPAFGMDDVRTMYTNLMEYMDNKEGGLRGAPKFPLPNNQEFLLHYHQKTGDKKALDQVVLTLKNMAMGGIYDQAGGGFARYTVDDRWKIPHFEKMLYDNGQLVSLYALAYKLVKEPLFKEVVYETVAFAERELCSPDGVFYSALDADSEGEEGRFYVWKERELDAVLGEDAPLIKQYYHIGGKAFWERGYNILLRDQDDRVFAGRSGLSLPAWQSVLSRAKQKLMEARSRRVRPGLDDKVLVSWNALMIKGLADAFSAFGDEALLSKACRAADFLLQHAMKENGALFRSLQGTQASIPGFLEDYAFFSHALIRLYEVSSEEKYLAAALKLARYVMEHFSVADTHMFAFSPLDGEQLAAPHFELYDNVMPSSNSVMARVLFYLANYYENPDFGRRSSLMLNDLRSRLNKYSSSFSNWGILLMHHLRDFYTVAVTGPQAVDTARRLSEHYLPDVLLATASSEAATKSIDVLHGRYSGVKTQIHVCSMGYCKLPVEGIEEALAQMSSKA